MSPEPQGNRRDIASWFKGWHWACWAAAVFFLFLVGRFYFPGTGLTSLVSIGDKLVPVPALRTVAHYIYEDSHGYDGAYYLQIALHPLLDSPHLAESVDSLHYRAKRILLSWTAWVLGAGQAAWIVQVYPLLNIFFWFALAMLLWRWLPPDSPGNVLRWAGVLFSHGACMSVRHSLVDAPSLLLIALSVAWWERRRTVGMLGALAAAALTKETSLLACTLFGAPPAAGWRWWVRNTALVMVIAAPLAGWMTYLRLSLGPPAETGLNNFTLPFAGLVQKWGVILTNLRGPAAIEIPTALTVLALTVQCGFFLLRWRPREVWWRVGASFAVLTVFVSQPVWEGYPGAATRVLLPMMLAFNLLVPRGARWMPLLLAGNLSLVAGLAEFQPPGEEVYRVVGERRTVSAVLVERGEGWYAVETDGNRTWRWCQQRARLKLINRTGSPCVVNWSMEVAAIGPRRLGLRLNGVQIWDAPLPLQYGVQEVPAFLLPPGENVVELVTDQPAQSPGNRDPRTLSFAVSNLGITVAPVPGGPQR